MEDNNEKILKIIYDKTYLSYEDYFKTVKKHFGSKHLHISKESIKELERYAKIDGNEYFKTLYGLLKKYKVEPIHMDMILTEIATWYYLSHFPSLECAMKFFMRPDGTVDGTDIYFEAMGD